MATFAPAFANGALDEWLSQRSAKPSTAVRIRQAPPKQRNPRQMILAGIVFYSSESKRF